MKRQMKVVWDNQLAGVSRHTNHFVIYEHDDEHDMDLDSFKLIIGVPRLKKATILDENNAVSLRSYIKPTDKMVLFT